MPHGIPFKKLGHSPRERLDILRVLVGALIKHERVETSFLKASETQKYMNRLIDIAKYGPENKYCSDMVNFWTKEDEDLKKKLFNVLVPRYSTAKGKYTRIAILQHWHNQSIKRDIRMSVLELKGNPLPPLPIKEENPHTLQNVLIAAAREEWNKNQSSK